MSNLDISEDILKSIKNKIKVNFQQIFKWCVKGTLQEQKNLTEDLSRRVQLRV